MCYGKYISIFINFRGGRSRVHGLRYISHLLFMKLKNSITIVTGRPQPRRETKERHKLQSNRAKIKPCKTHTVNATGEGEATNEGEN